MPQVQCAEGSPHEAFQAWLVIAGGRVWKITQGIWAGVASSALLTQELPEHARERVGFGSIWSLWADTVTHLGADNSGWDLPRPLIWCISVGMSTAMPLPL